jgi:hypothetical protein
VTGITTTGVVAGDLLWVQSSSGRQFSIIASVDSGTQVTCDDAFSNTESGRTWAIGGKRATLENASSRLILQSTNGKTDWIVELEETGSPYTIDTSLAIGVAMTLRGNVGAVEIRQTSNTSAIILQAGTSVVPWLRKIKVTNSNPTKTLARGVHKSNSVDGGFNLEDCILGDPVYQLLHGAMAENTGGPLGLRLVRCLITNCTSHGISNASQLTVVLRSSVVNNGGHGITNVSGANSMIISSTVVSGNALDGINLATISACQVDNSIIVNNAGDGIELASMPSMVIYGNIIAGNGGFGIRGGFDTNAFKRIFDFNIFSFPTNSSGSSSVMTGGSNDITLTVDPFIWSKRLTAVSWTSATKRLNKVGGFANVHVDQLVNVTGGTGVTPGMYEIASVDSANQITLVASIAASDTADVTTSPDFNLNNIAGGGADLRAATVVLP